MDCLVVSFEIQLGFGDLFLFLVSTIALAGFTEAGKQRRRIYPQRRMEVLFELLTEAARLGFCVHTN